MFTTKIKLSLRLISLILLTSLCQVHAQITCLADFSLLSKNELAIEIIEKPDGFFDASINGVVTNSGDKVEDETIRPGLNFSADPYSEEFKLFNSAERSLIHIQAVLTEPITSRFLNLSLSPLDVQRIKTFNLNGKTDKTDKFGGQVLLELRDHSDVLLGRLVRNILLVSCQ